MTSDQTTPFRTMNPLAMGTRTKEEIAQEIAETEARVELRVALPFLYGWKWYKWARSFYESTNKINLLTAANQISKSSTQIRKCINWATDKSLWASLWNETPNQFWYLYPSQDVVNAEFMTKWKQFLPSGKFKDDPVYGWKEMKDGKDTVGIEFFSGVIVFFKTYGQKATNLQTGTVFALFCDEELPIHLFDELMHRINATDGYFHMVFTATMGQDEWRRAMEPTESELKDGKEFLPQAFKQTVSLYDSQFYEDGSPSKWTMERIKQVEARCSTHNEILKRVFGKFIMVGGRKYESFDLKRHTKPKHPVPRGWLIYAGADIGSGGPKGHPSALVYVAVSPDMRQGRVFLGWRGDGIITTAGDVVKKNIELKKEHKFETTQQFYDWASKDFYNIALTANDPWEPADKSHERGEEVINTLFKHDMLYVYEDPELSKLCSELASLKKEATMGAAKRSAKDDFSDGLRYAVSKIPWDFSNLTAQYDDKQISDPDEELTPLQLEIKQRRAAFNEAQDDEEARLQEEFDEVNDLYGY